MQFATKDEYLIEYLQESKNI